VCEKNANVTQEEEVAHAAETPSRSRTVVVSVITASPATAPPIPATARVNDAFIDADLPPSYEEAIKLPPNRHYQLSLSN
jgi:hypothetical protein